MKNLVILIVTVLIFFLSGCVKVDVDADADKWKKVGDGYADKYRSGRSDSREEIREEKDKDDDDVPLI